MDTNIIKKQVLEITANYMADGLALQRTVDTLSKQLLIPQLEILLDRYAPKDEVLFIDQIQVEIENLSLNELDTVFMSRILDATEEQLKKEIAKSREKYKGVNQSVRRRAIELFVFYLKEGFFPWQVDISNSIAWDNFLAQISSPGVQTDDWKILKEALGTSIVRERLLTVLAEKQYWGIIDFICLADTTVFLDDLRHMEQAINDPEHRAIIKEHYCLALTEAISRAHDANTTNSMMADLFFHCLAIYPALPGYFKKPFTFRNKVLQIRIDQQQRKIDQEKQTGRRSPLAAGYEIDTEGRQIDEKATSLSEVNGTAVNADEQAQLTEQEVLAEEQYISCAGLVIIAPFLFRFFDSLDIIHEGKLTDISKAVHLLQYLAKGDLAYAEWECVLPKIICGVKIASVIRIYKLSEEEKMQADDLLRAVIGHWKVLKNTSIEGLRTSFLQRAGRLVCIDKEWKLKVETAAYDVLLAHLPWNIQLIKLPWMEHLLKVDWE